MNKEQNIGELEWGLGHPQNTPIIYNFKEGSNFATIKQARERNHSMF